MSAKSSTFASGRASASSSKSAKAPAEENSEEGDLVHISWLKRNSFAFVLLLNNFSRKSGAETGRVFAMLLPLFRRDPGAPAQSRVQVSVP